MNKIGVVTPAGNVGTSVVQNLLSANQEMVLIGQSRHRARLTDAIERGAEFRIANLDAPLELESALKGVDSLFWLTPPDMQADMRGFYVRTAQAAAHAIKANKISRVVNVSAVGAGMTADLGTVSYVGDVESILNESCSNVLHLRPGFFMENLLFQSAGLAAGKISFPFAPDHDIPWISAVDIGTEAGSFLQDTTWAGKWIRHLLGPENLTGSELALRLSKILGRDIRYEQSSFAELAEGLRASQLTPGAIEEFVKTYRALGDPNGVYAIPRTPEAQTPTTIEAFARMKMDLGAPRA